MFVVAATTFFTRLTRATKFVTVSDFCFATARRALEASCSHSFGGATLNGSSEGRMCPITRPSSAVTGTASAGIAAHTDLKSCAHCRGNQRRRKAQPFQNQQAHLRSTWVTLLTSSLVARATTCLVWRDGLENRRARPIKLGAAGCTAGRARVSAASRPEERYLDRPPRRLNHLGAVGVWRLGGRRALHAEQRWPHDAPAPDSECERLHGTRELHPTHEGYARCE